MIFTIGISDNKHAAKLSRALGFLIIFTFLILPLSAQAKKRGKVTTHYASGKNESSGKVKNYKKQGVWKYWSENGTLIKTITWKDDMKQGLYTEYHSNGKKSLEGNYYDDHRNGVWNAWYNDGQLSSKLNYKNGDNAKSFDGLQQWWFENGQLRERSNYANFQIVYRETWFKNGKRRAIESYKNGVAEGTWRKYLPSSESTDTLPASVDNYVAGKREGVHLGYVRGRLSEEFYYKDDKLDGSYKKWDTNSQLGVSENYVDGKPDGLCKYFNYGKCIREVMYEKGRINGEEKEYDGKGDLYRIAWYKKGIIDSSYNYHKNGKLAISRTYKYYPGFVRTEEFSEYTEWDSSGVLLLRGTYHFEMKDKDWTTYYTNGKTKSVTPYSSGRIRGTYKKWYANGKKMIEMECDGYYAVAPPRVWDEKGKELKAGTKAYNEIVDSSKPGEIYNDPKRYKNNRTDDDAPAVYEIDDRKIGVITQDGMGQEGDYGEYDVIVPTVDKMLDTKIEETFSFAEQMPEFPGGSDAMKQFIRENMKYPRIEEEMGKQGTVYISFIVEKDGSVTNVKEAKGVSGAPGLTKEAIRLVSSFPKYSPALMNGRAVRLQMTVPIRFVLK